MSGSSATQSAGFDALYRASRDPWGTSSRWYERRKRALLMASLPHAHYERVYEAGCGTGHVSIELSDRATHLLAGDASVEALAIARAALAGRSNATVEHHVLPAQWPPGAFDLVVLGEVLYFLDDAARASVARDAREATGTSGIVVACNWRHAIEGWGHRGEDVHQRFSEELALPRLYDYRDDDFVLTGWSHDTATPAMRDGLR